MLAELGHFAVILALLAAVCQTALPMAGARFAWSGWMRVAKPAAVAQFTLTAIAFSALTSAFVRSDFSVALVAAHSHSAKPLIYKLSGVWGNHEGSMLLWVLVLTFFGMLVACFGSNLPVRLKALVLAVQSSVSGAFFAFILFTSNPFERLAMPPFEGRGLNPLLQDPGLAFHPPFLYMGYVGLSVAFSFAAAALISGRADAAWARWIRPWTLASWGFLTVGIAMGSWWAYYELGWGGWWFWDPVENASFMPWLLATALLHSAAIAEKRECLKSWTVLLAILAFSFSLMGTFLVRSGIITSVHAFATDPGRGLFILVIFFVFTGGALFLYALRSAAFVPEGAFGLISREAALIVNNVLLVVATFVVFLGTFWPLAAELIFDRMVSVGPPYFEFAFSPFMLALALLLPLGAALPWKRGSAQKTAKRMRAALLAAFLTGAAALWLQDGSHLTAPIGLAIAAWLIAGAMTDLALRAAPRRASAQAVFSRTIGLPGADWGKFLAHAGLGVTIAGIAAVTAWEIEDIRISSPGDLFEIGGYSLRFENIGERQGANFRALRAEFTLIDDGKSVGILRPERRHYPAAGSDTTEAAIDIGFWRDVYVVVGDAHPGGGYTVKTYLKPLVNWIWLGALLMAAGSLISLTDRRLRTGSFARRSGREISAR